MDILSNWFVYIVKCSDNTYYTGITTDTDKRIEKHNKGNGAKYTRSRNPVKLVYFKPSLNRSSASKEEHRIKSLTREDKILLINNNKLPLNN